MKALSKMHAHHIQTSLQDFPNLKAEHIDRTSVRATIFLKLCFVGDLTRVNVG